MKRLILSLIGILVLGAAGYYGFVTYFQPQSVEAEEATVAVSAVSRGDLVLTAAGVAVLMPGGEINLGFSTTGIVEAVHVEVGDDVKAGDLLATLDDSAISSQLSQATINLRLAELELSGLERAASIAEIAAAQATLASAQADYDRLLSPASESELAAARDDLYSAQIALNELLSGPSTDELTTLQADLRSAEIALADAQADYDAISWRSDVGRTSQAATLQSATIAYEKALAQYNINSAGAGEDVIATARARVFQAQNQLDLLTQGADAPDIAAAEAKVTQAEAQLDELLAGADVDELERAQLSAQQARLTLNDVLRDLRGSEIKAPVDGVVTAVEVDAGEQAGTTPVIRIVEQNRAQVQFWVEELDIASVKPGNPVSVLFEAFPDHSFSGEITRIEPGLVDLSGAAAIQAWASIDMSEHDVPLLFGMNAEIEIVAGETRGALLAPVQALREISANQYAVFVVHDDGELEFRPVEVGLRDFVNAEILSGLEMGEQVSTGDVQTQ